MATLKDRFIPAIVDYEPYEDPEDPGEPSFAEVSLVGTCPEHGFQRVVRESVTPGFDPSTVFWFQCGDVDLERF